MHVLVTGATGFVGAYAVRRLLADGARVRILRRPESSLALLGEAAEAVEHAVGDITDADAVREAVRGASHVVHVAATVAFGPRNTARLRAVNVGGTATVVNAALDEGVSRLVHTSSIAALGRQAGGRAPIDETTPWMPGRANTRYAVSKRDAELEVWRGAAEGLDAVAVHPALVFGPGRPGDGTYALVERVAAGRMRVAPPGATAVVDVRDVADGLVAALHQGRAGGRYVLASDNLSWLELLTRLADAFGVPPPSRTVPAAALLAAGTLADAWVWAGGSAALSRETARTAAGSHAYSNRRAVEELGLAFRPFGETARWLAQHQPKAS